MKKEKKANFEAFRWNISLSTNLSFLKSVGAKTACLHFYYYFVPASHTSVLYHGKACLIIHIKEDKSDFSPFFSP